MWPSSSCWLRLSGKELKFILIFKSSARRPYYSHGCTRLYDPAGKILRFSLSLRHIATALAPNDTNMINARAEQKLFHLQHWCPWFQTQHWQLRQLWEPFGHSHSATFFPLSGGLDIYLIMPTPAILSFTFWLIWLIVWNRLISSLIFVFNILSEGGTQYSPIIWYHSNRGPWQQPPFLCVRAGAS